MVPLNFVPGLVIGFYFPYVPLPPCSLREEPFREVLAYRLFLKQHKHKSLEEGDGQLY